MSAFLKCECCGADLKPPADGTTVECEYCGRTVYWKEPKSDALVMALDRANNFRRANRFSDAIMEYKLITEQNPGDAEAWWGLTLSTFGIEYVKDPRTERFVPTCHRTVRLDIFENPDYRKAIENASSLQRRDYQEQAEEINRLQKRILKLAEEGEDYDVFISFKSTDDKTGRITRDAQIARIIYDELANRGIKTFFSDVTLRGMLFSEYEPIIFRALTSCKFFVLVATNEEYLNSPWVKNEWSRFEERMETEKLSGVACAVFDGQAVHDLPSFVRAQGVDLRRYEAGGYEKNIADSIERKMGRSKKSAEEERILRQLEEQKRLQKEFEERQRQAQIEMEERLKSMTGSSSAPVASGSATVASLLKRARQEMDAGEWGNAGSYLQRVIDADPENADAWWGQFLLESKATDESEIGKKIETVAQLKELYAGRNYKSAKRYATGALKDRIARFEHDLTAAEVLLPRARGALEKSQFQSAKNLYERVLSSDGHSAEAWWGLFLVEMNCINEDLLLSSVEIARIKKVMNSVNFANAAQYAEGELAQKIVGFKNRLAERVRGQIASLERAVAAQDDEIAVAREERTQRRKSASTEIAELQTQLQEVNADIAKQSEKVSSARLKVNRFQKAAEKKPGYMPLWKLIGMIIIWPVFCCFVISLPFRAIARSSAKRKVNKWSAELRLQESALSQLQARKSGIERKLTALRHDDYEKSVKSKQNLKSTLQQKLADYESFLVTFLAK